MRASPRNRAGSARAASAYARIQHLRRRGGRADLRRRLPRRAHGAALRCRDGRDRLQLSAQPAAPDLPQPALLWFGGGACSRGIAWAESVARRQPALLRQAWPAHEGRTAELARSKVRDLCEDPRVIDVLARGVSEHAARRWRQLQAQTGGPG
jgi:hypothetical protein